MQQVPLRFKKSSRSTATSECVEIAHTLRELRDSKNPTGPNLQANAQALIAYLKPR